MFYAVYKGYVSGVYQTWKECETQIKNFPKAKFKKFESFNDAKEYSLTGKSIIVSKPKPKIGILSDLDLLMYLDQKGPRIGVLDENGTIIKNVKVEEQIEPQEDIISVYTDGACSNNGKLNPIAGYGVYFPDYPDIFISEKLKLGLNGEQVSNQRAELKACIEGIKKAKEIKDEGAKIYLYTDSKYSIQCVSAHTNKYGKVCSAWIIAWKMNGWKTKDNEPVKNKDLIEELYTLSKGVKFIHVKGHSDNIGNIKADQLAVLGKNKLKE